MVTLDRIKRIDVEPDLGVWKEYAYKENIHPAIISYLGIKGQNFCHIETTVDGKLFATPRGWEDLSELILVYEKLEKRADRDVIGQYIQHPRIAKDFANYLELYYKYQNQYQVDQILEGIIREDLCDKVARASFDERLSVTGLLLSKLADGFKGMFMENQVMAGTGAGGRAGGRAEGRDAGRDAGKAGGRGADRDTNRGAYREKAG